MQNLKNDLKIKNAYIGIDPGKTGAIVLMADNPERAFDEKCNAPVAFSTTPQILFEDFSDASVLSAVIWQWSMEFNIVMACLEAVSSRPGQGVVSVFSFGQNFGIWQGILAALRIPHTLVSPQRWQKGLFRKDDGDGKERSLTVARRIFPEVSWLSRKKDHGRADALLLARYAKDNYSGNV